MGDGDPRSRLPFAFAKSEVAQDKGFVFKSMPEIDLKEHHQSKMKFNFYIMRGTYIFSNILAGVGTNGTISKHVEIIDMRTGHVTII